MNRAFKPKLKAFMRDYQSPYRYSSANANNRSVDVIGHQTSVEQHFDLAPEIVAERTVEETRPSKPRSFHSKIPKVSAASPKAKHTSHGAETPKQSRSFSAKPAW